MDIIKCLKTITGIAKGMYDYVQGKKKVKSVAVHIQEEDNNEEYYEFQFTGASNTLQSSKSTGQQ